MRQTKSVPSAFAETSPIKNTLSICQISFQETCRLHFQCVREKQPFPPKYLLPTTKNMSSQHRRVIVKVIYVKTQKVLTNVCKTN